MTKAWQSEHLTAKEHYQHCISLVDALFKRQIKEEMLFGIFLLQKLKRVYTDALFDHFNDWIQWIENWELCDQLASIACLVVAKNHHLFEPLQQWTLSSNLWRRRFVLATASSLNHYGLNHVDEVLVLCDNLVEDREPVVEKALHWAIREASKKDPDKIFVWLTQKRDNMKRGVLRQAAEKLFVQQRGTMLIFKGDLDSKIA
jgi:3-methyladenine DNA glycosylase AlkD